MAAKQKQKGKKQKKKRTLLEIAEIWVDRSIPFWLIILTVLIVLSLLPKRIFDIHRWEPWVTIIDTLVVAFFIIDLCFKYRHVRNIPKFIRMYWLDLIAVFPFYLIFRGYLIGVEYIRAGEEAQKVLHEALLLREVGILRETRILREAELAAKEARGLMRGIRLIQRGFRALRLRWHKAHFAILLVHKKRRDELRKMGLRR